jgi:Mrp family chromosome partitioning ATPase/predicted Fe-Mo cluster-binding NifX family protein
MSEKCPSGADPQSCGADPKSCSGCDPQAQAATRSQEEAQLQKARKQIRHKLLVMSGKGGVGKSSVAVNLALSLARRGYKVGLMDVDLHGPNVLRMLGLTEPLDLMHAQFRLPPDLMDHLRVVSIEMLMRNREVAVIWRGPLKHQLIRQFLTEVQWDSLDYLIIDAPPGTGDEPMSVAQTIPEAQAIIVTTPQEISLADVRKSIDFCRKINMNILGVVENMSGYSCPHCGKEIPLFKQGGGARTAQEAKVPFLGSLPFDPRVLEAEDQGQLLQLPEKDSAFMQALSPIAEYVLETLAPTAGDQVREPGVWKFAVPLQGGKVAAQFPQAEQFEFFTVRDGKIEERQLLLPPPPGTEAIPMWLEDLGVTHVLAASLPPSAQALLGRKGMEVVAAAAQEAPEALVAKYLQEHPAAPVAACGCSQCSTP